MPGVMLPTLSSYDPTTSSEGALDPVGLYAIADALALKLVPGIRERMSHPRFLTSMAVGALITRSYDADELAADGQTEPWMVYEWHIVEGLVRSRGKDPALRELPGIQKARDAFRDSVNLSASRYLKTATVFGFHGVYRPLAVNLDIVCDKILCETGFELLTTWETEQGLDGFSSRPSGAGATFRNQLESAVQDGLKKGAVSRSDAWGGWYTIGKHLFPNEIPPGEAKIIVKALRSDPTPSRNQVIRFLSSSQGNSLWTNSSSERVFHEGLIHNVDSDVRMLLNTIMAYERFSRLLQDAFDDCRFAMTQWKSKVSPGQMAQEKGCKDAYSQIRDSYQETDELLAEFGLASRFENAFVALAEPTSIEDWLNALLDHHDKVQQNKPPQGKNPWLERFDDGTAVIRPQYRRSEPARHDDSYVNMYRTAPLNSFLKDLRLIEAKL